MAKRSAWVRQLQTGFEKGRRFGSKRKPEIRLSRVQAGKIFTEHPALRTLVEAENAAWLAAEPFQANTGKMLDYLKKHPRQVSELLNKRLRVGIMVPIGAISESNAPQKLLEAVSKNVFLHEKNGKLLPRESGEAVRQMVQQIAFDEFARAKIDYIPFFRRKYKEYLTQVRRIPLSPYKKKTVEEQRVADDEFFDRNFNAYIKDGLAANLAEGHFNIADFEAQYILSLKQERTIQSNYGRFANMALREATKGRAVPKEALKKEKERIITQAREIIIATTKQQVQSEVRKLKGGEVISHQRFLELSKENERLVSQQIDPFIERTTKRAKEFATRFPLMRNGKKGKNEQAVEKEALKVIPENIKQTRREERQAVARALGIPYDPYPEILESIEAIDPPRAQLLRRLVAEGTLSPHTFSILHSKRGKPEAVFFKVLRDNEFNQKFGREAVEPLARILTYLGRGKGHINEKVEKKAVIVAEQSGGHQIGHKLMTFLKQHHYLDPTHTGKHVTYLDNGKP